MIRNIFLSLVFLALAGCSMVSSVPGFSWVQPTRDAVVNTSVREYCQLPESVRLANRDRFRISPDKEPFIEIHCERL